MSRLLFRTLFVVLLSFFAAPTAAVAQQTGTLSGIVQDTGGNVLPGVTIAVASPALIGGARTTVSGESGSYQFASLPPGTYTVTYELAGFTTLKRDEIRVLVAATTRLDVDLAVGGVKETVTVTGDSPVVDVSIDHHPDEYRQGDLRF